MTPFDSLRSQTQGVLGSAYNLPLHALRRIHALMGRDDVLFIDGRLDVPDVNVYTGEIVVLTKRKVINARLTNATNKLDPSKERTSTVAVDAWSRSALLAVTIATHGEQPINSDDRWQGEVRANNPQPDADTWPKDAQVSLTYSGRVAPLLLPLGDIDDTGRREFATVLPSLLADLD